MLRTGCYGRLVKTTLRISVALIAVAIAGAGCSKKDAGGGGSKSGLAWEPIGYDKLSAICKKDLACCEEIATADGAKTPDDYNLKCSGPAIFKDDECDVDLKSRVSGLESKGKPVPASCK
jgi:hypothetical protein